MKTFCVSVDFRRVMSSMSELRRIDLSAFPKLQKIQRQFGSFQSFVPIRSFVARRFLEHLKRTAISDKLQRQAGRKRLTNKSKRALYNTRHFEWLSVTQRLMILFFHVAGGARWFLRAVCTTQQPHE